MTLHNIKQSSNIQKSSAYYKALEMLKSFGLSQNESLVYIHLLKKGEESGASDISLAVGIHRQYVYQCINSLIELGLIDAVRHGAQHKYKALPPAQIAKIAKRKLFEAQDIVHELNVFSRVGEEQNFEIFSGDAQVRSYESDFMNRVDENETQYVISGGSQNFIDYFGDEYDKLSVRGRKKKLATYYIGGPHDTDYLAYANRINPYFKYRILSGLPKGKTSTVVRQNSVVLYSLAKPPLIYVIHSQSISEEYKAQFDMLWDLAK